MFGLTASYVVAEVSNCGGNGCAGVL